MERSLPRRFSAEFIGTAILLAAVVGSGIMAERLAGSNVAVALLANTIATAAALIALILMFAPVSGAHFNPVVTVVSLIDGGVKLRDALFYLVAQLTGALLGTALANLMFELPVFFASTKVRYGASQWLGELIATFGLVGVIICVTRRYKSVVIISVAVAAWITAAIWFTSSTSFANPAVTIARSLSDTFTGIRPVDAPMFIVAQFVGGLSAAFVFRWLVPKEEMTKKKRVLILCTGNSARSQMAEGLLRQIAGDKFDVESAGTIASFVRPQAIAAMAEIGVDITGHRSKCLDEFLDTAFDYVITVCDNANETCPVFPGPAKRIHWSFDDPAEAVGSDEQQLAVFRRVRDEIAEKLRAFASAN